MKLFVTSYILIWASAGFSSAAPLVRLDFSNSHSFQIVEDSGFPFAKNASGIASYRIMPDRPLDLVVVLPGGVEISQSVEVCSFGVNERNELDSMYFHGQGLPTTEAYAVANRSLSLLGVERTGLDQWFETNKGEGWGGIAFSGAGPSNFYPSVFVEITTATNPLYPWKLSTNLGWKNIREREKGRNESWGKENNKVYPPGIASISLNPSNGKNYDSQDAYRGKGKTQAKLDEEFGQVRDAGGNVIASPRTITHQRKQASVVKDPKKYEYYIISSVAYIFGIFAIIWSIWFVLLRKRVGRV